MSPGDDGIQVTNRDIYEKLEGLEVSFADHREEVAVAFGKRPTRAEVMSLLGGAVLFSSAVFTAVRFI